MDIQLSDHFTYSKLLRFTLPSVAMMIFSSIYGVVDGFFVSNFVGKVPFAAINFIMPVPMMLSTVGFMLGTGGSALVAKTMGERNDKKANELFSMFVYATIICGIAITALAITFIRPIAAMLGAEGEMLEYCVQYGRIVLLAFPANMLQLEFQTFFVTAEKPQLGFWVTFASGVANMVLDALFIAVFRWGIAGAAVATACAQLIGGIVPLIYFSRPNDSRLHLVKTKYDGNAMMRAMTNGSSEPMSNVSMSLVNILYNTQLLKYAGEDGIAAYGVMMYVNFIFISTFIGYSIGTAPIIGFQYGAQNHDEMKSLAKKSTVIIVVSSVCMAAMGIGLAQPLSAIFVSYDPELLEMTVSGFRIFSFSFLFAGIALFTPSFFTALNDGLISALISFLRALVFQVGAVVLLPLIWGIDGIWYSVVVAEFLAAIVSAVFVIVLRKKYHYL